MSVGEKCHPPSATTEDFSFTFACINYIKAQPSQKGHGKHFKGERFIRLRP